MRMCVRGGWGACVVRERESVCMRVCVRVCECVHVSVSLCVRA